MEESTIDHVSIRFYWSNPMTIDQTTDLVYNFLVDLGTISPILNGWCDFGKSRKDALSKKFEISPAYIKRNLLRSHKKNMDERGYSNIGYRIGAWKEVLEEQTMSLDIYTNDLKELFSALCELKYRNMALFDIDTLLTILRCMLKHFKPDYGCVDTYILRKIKYDNNIYGEKFLNYFGWISYTHKKNLKLGDEFIVEKDETGGSLIRLNHAAQFYDYDRTREILELGRILK